MISWTVLKETHQASQFALLSTISSLVMLIAMPVIGIIVDRYDHKHLLVIAQVFSLFVCFTELYFSTISWFNNLHSFFYWS
ncbi:hypothetical protein [Lactococcus cremoris]